MRQKKDFKRDKNFLIILHVDYLGIGTKTIKDFYSPFFCLLNRKNLFIKHRLKPVIMLLWLTK